MQEYVKDGNYYVVQSFMIKELKLKGVELAVYAIIYGFSQAGQEFNGSLKYLEEWTCSSRQGVINALKSLTEKKRIIKSESIVDGVCACTYKASKEVVNLVDHGSQKSVPGWSTKCTGGSQLSLPNNINNNINNNTPPIPPVEQTRAESQDEPQYSFGEPLFFNEPSVTDKPRAVLFTDGFDDFWAVYPRHQSKSEAAKAWSRLHPSAKTQELIKAAVNKAKSSFDWQKEKGTFIPYPATYLNGRRWEDEEPQPENKYRFVN